MTLSCAECGSPFERTNNAQKFCSRTCRLVVDGRRKGYGDRRAFTCAGCGVNVVPGVGIGPAAKRFCSSRCRRRASRGVTGPAFVAGECPECGDHFVAQWHPRLSPYCSSRCAHRVTQRRRRKSMDGEKVHTAAVGDRDGWVCGICGQPADRQLTWPDPWAPVVDHILALVRGGTNDDENLQLAHARCNSIKSCTVDRRNISRAAERQRSLT